MKPRDRVVTAEDIQNSLYFVHVECPDDSRLVEPPSFREPQYGEQSSQDQPQSGYTQRKAIPDSSLPSMLPAGPKRKPVPGSPAPVNDFQNRQNIVAPNHTHTSNLSRHNAVASNTTHTSSSLLAPEYPPRRSFDSLQYQAENERPPSLPPRPSGSIQGTSLTLIRRDPASGAQWNVARIEDPPILDVSSSTLNDSPKKQIGAPLFVEITNPGYSKFLGSEDSAHVAATSRNKVFRRRLWMEGARNNPNGGFGHRRLESQDSYRSTDSPRNSSEDRREGSSIELRRPEPPAFLTRENQSYSTIQVSNRQSTFRGYVFMSPWNGRCEFLTGAGGGSLKVRV
jgi:hypothetical protein